MLISYLHLHQHLDFFPGLLLGTGSLPGSFTGRPHSSCGWLALALGPLGLPLPHLCLRSPALGSRECALQRCHWQKWRRVGDLGTDSAHQRQTDASRSSHCWRWLAIFFSRKIFGFAEQRATTNNPVALVHLDGVQFYLLRSGFDDHWAFWNTRWQCLLSGRKPGSGKKLYSKKSFDFSSNRSVEAVWNENGRSNPTEPHPTSHLC